MLALPNHVAIGLVAENGDVLPPHQVGNLFQIVDGRHTAGRVVGRIEEDGPRRFVFRQEPFDLGDLRAELIRLSQRPHDGPGAPPLDVRQIGRKIGPEDEHAIARVQKRLAEELLKDFCPGAGDNVLGLGRDAELAFDEAGGCLAELGDAGGRAIVRLVVLDGLDARRLGRCRAVEGAVADFQLDDVLSGRFETLGDGQHGERRLDGERTGKLA